MCLQNSLDAERSRTEFAFEISLLLMDELDMALQDVLSRESLSAILHWADVIKKFIVDDVHMQFQIPDFLVALLTLLAFELRCGSQVSVVRRCKMSAVANLVRVQICFRFEALWT